MVGVRDRGGLSLQRGRGGAGYQRVNATPKGICVPLHVRAFHCMDKVRCILKSRTTATVMHLIFAYT